MSEKGNQDPMHGKTLKAMLEELVERFGWDDLAGKISINCFASNPSLSSSLKFLRKTPWARNKVEMVYRESIGLPPLNPRKKEGPASDPVKSKAREKPSRVQTSQAPAINPWTGETYEK